MSITVIVALVALVAFVALKLRGNTKITSFKEQGGVPFFAAALAYAQNPVATIRRATSQAGNIFSIQLFTVYNVWLRGNDLNKVYLETREDTWSFGGGMGIFLNRILDGGYWPHLRTLAGSLAHWLNRSATLDYVTKVSNEEAEKSFSNWSTKSDVELFESVSGLVHQVIVRCLMGQDFYDKSCSELLDLLHAMEADIGSLYNMFLPAWVSHPPAKRLDAARERVREIFNQRLQERSMDPETWSKSSDYINYTLSDKTMLPLKDLLPSHHTLLMFAAHTSTVANIAWAIIEILRHPDILAELQKTLRESPEEADSLLLQACIKETSRFYAGMSTLRIARKDHTIPTTSINVPAGALVSISPYLTHHDPANFSNPDQWTPDRWISQEGGIVQLDQKQGLKYIPFGAGSHRCVGEKMAAIVASRALSTLIRNYNVEWANGEPRSEVTDFDFGKLGTPWLKGDTRVKVTKRV
ncbi:cytochrome P450 4F8 [Hypoxylon trugodes]|uniref:cytochrome P450 4F8 n=1 Tax=Hypoxylon trugodes TaxID=326681 RepID=UPI0021A12BE5|nr:cytochrome P450 4F8 [Hypoxylon trugodes]KAI1391905.1 cytochrome P450 4F8 [Hypoxylon trugodes]